MLSLFNAHPYGWDLVPRRTASELDDFFRAPLLRTDELLAATPSLKMDVKETDNAFLILADTPGVKPDEINIQLEDGVMTISGKREKNVEEKNEQGKVIRVERSHSSFSRSLTLPEHVDADSITATSENGVLTITVPKVAPTEKPAPKRIPVK